MIVGIFATFLCEYLTRELTTFPRDFHEFPSDFLRVSLRFFGEFRNSHVPLLLTLLTRLQIHLYPIIHFEPNKSPTRLKFSVADSDRLSDHFSTKAGRNFIYVYFNLNYP